MNISAPDIVLAAKRHEIEELRRLASKAEFVEVIGHLIHALQSERGASSIFLASGGDRFASTRLTLAAETQAIEAQLRKCFEVQLRNPSFGSARLLSLMAWVLLGMDELPALREQISEHRLKAYDAILALSRLIAGLVSLIFEVADSAIDPHISRSLVALFNFIQGKELAGQERAIGALCFASGSSDGAHQQRVHHLIEAQEKSFQTFSDFADEKSLAQWQEIQGTPAIVQLERLRRVLLTTRPGAQLDPNLSGQWFECCSDRLANIWSLQCGLVNRLQENCAFRVGVAERNLEDSAGLLQALLENPPSSAGMLERFFDPNVPVDQALRFQPSEGMGTQFGHSIISVLQAQSARLASMEGELDKAKRALNERKVVERAKGVLMAQLNLTEEAAYKLLRKTAMDQNRRLVDIAEATLSLPMFAAPPQKAHQN